MPQVGKKSFPYTQAGKKAAKSYAKKSGQEVEKYYGGGSVDPFSTKNPKGVPAEQFEEGAEKQNMAQNMEDAIPTTNAMDRSQKMPDTEQYKDGGKVKSKKVDVTDIVKEAEKPSKSFEPRSDEYVDVKPTKAWPWSEPKRRTYGDIEKENPTGGGHVRRREGGARKRSSVRSLAKKVLKGKKK